ASFVRGSQFLSGIPRPLNDTISSANGCHSERERGNWRSGRRWKRAIIAPHPARSLADARDDIAYRKRINRSPNNIHDLLTSGSLSLTTAIDRRELIRVGAEASRSERACHSAARRRRGIRLACARLAVLSG